MQYDLSRLTGQSFQRLVESLCLAEFGTAAKVYSQGADGGRDLTLNGEVPGYEARRWNGYVVMQAKYKETAAGDGVSWLIAQLGQELALFLQSKSRVPPKYYIVVTNISLSGADSVVRGRPKRGGFTKVETELDTWKRKLGVLDYDIWAQEKICKLLDKHDGVRKAYLAWIAPGDVLGAMLAQMEGPELGQVIPRAIRRSLPRDQYVQLKDAGDVNDGRLRSSQCFIDLPVLDGTEQPPLHDNRKLVARLIDLGKDRLVADEFEAGRGPRGNLIVVLGGPGQGKSTASKFLVQVHRASLISQTKNFKKDPDLADLIPEILHRAAEEHVGQPSSRYPVHISLPEYADVAARGEDQISLLRFLADQLSRDCELAVTVASVRKWLKVAPWLIVLDGLDEVPPSGGRKVVIEAINRLVSEITEQDADALIVVTTRPQGFNDDLPPSRWQHWKLSDLSTAHAVAYASRLGELRHPHESQRREDVLSRISAAATSSSIEKIMVTPLQVTILYVIADSGGEIPNAKWDLFQRYYDVLIQREMAKGGDIYDAIRGNLQHVARIHRWAGLALHLISETAGGSAVSLTDEQFRNLLKSSLQEGGVTADELPQQLERLTHVALNRLVLLSSRTEGQISFDVRSLQEFMAADALTVGGDAVFGMRMRAILTGAHWRHVALIAASRCYSSGSHEHLRPTLLGIVRELDSLSQEDTLVMSGARLALDMFVDGVAFGSTVQRVALLTHALSLVRLGPKILKERAPHLWGQSTDKELIVELRPHLIDEGKAFLGSWAVVLAGVRLENRHAVAVSNELWSSDISFVRSLVTELAIPLPSQNISNDVRSIILNSRPDRESIYIGRSVVGDRKTSGVPKEWADFTWLQAASRRADVSLLPQIGGRNLRMRVRWLGEHAENAGTSGILAWGFFSEIGQFDAEPSPESLAAALRAISVSELGDSAREIASVVPWVLGTILRAANDASDLRNLATDALGGRFGTGKGWAEAQERWSREGISEQDFIATSSIDYLKSAAEVGAPLTNFLSAYHADETALVAASLGRLALSLPTDHLARETMLGASAFGMSIRGIDFASDATLAADVYDAATDVDSVYFEAFSPADIGIRSNAERVNKLAAIMRPAVIESDIERITALIRCVASNPDLRSILLVISLSLIGESAQGIRDMLDQLPDSEIVDKHGDDPRIALAIQILKVLKHGLPDDVSDIVALLDMEGDLGTANILASLAENHGHDRRGIIPLLSAISAHGGQASERARETLRGVLDARFSALQVRENWEALGLPKAIFDEMAKVAPLTHPPSSAPG